MMDAYLDSVASILIIIGAVFCLTASIGLIRLPDIYSRMHAASKAGTLGSGLMLLAIAVNANDIGVVTRALAAIIFFLLTAPVSAHLLARAAYFMGYTPWQGTQIDDLAGKYDKKLGSVSCNSKE